MNSFLKNVLGHNEITVVLGVNDKVLSSNDFTTAEKNKLASIANNANNYTYTLPNATSSAIGGVKLYSELGDNIDGVVTQKALKSALNFSS